MLLDHRAFLVKERVALLKLTDRYDIFDPESGEQLGYAKEVVNGFVKLLRMFLNKQFFPTSIVIKEDDDSEPLLTIRRGFMALRPKVSVIDRNGNAVGFFRSTLFSIAGGFTVHKPDGEQIGRVKGKWIGWDFQLLDKNDKELGKVTKKWDGAIREIFTSADTYVIALNDSVEDNPGLSALLLAAGLAIDIVFRESK